MKPVSNYTCLIPHITRQRQTKILIGGWPIRRMLAFSSEELKRIKAKMCRFRRRQQKRAVMRFTGFRGDKPQSWLTLPRRWNGTPLSLYRSTHRCSTVNVRKWFVWPLTIMRPLFGRRRRRLRKSLKVYFTSGLFRCRSHRCAVTTLKTAPPSSRRRRAASPQWCWGGGYVSSGTSDAVTIYLQMEDGRCQAAPPHFTESHLATSQYQNRKSITPLSPHSLLSLTLPLMGACACTHTHFP